MDGSKGIRIIRGCPVDPRPTVELLYFIYQFIHGRIGNKNHYFASRSAQTKSDTGGHHTPFQNSSNALQGILLRPTLFWRLS